jgi:hypothetical protein
MALGKLRDVRWRRLTLMAALAACNHDSPMEVRSSGLIIASAPSRSDTALAKASRPLVLEIRDPAGAAIPGLDVTIRSTVRGSTPTMLLDSVTHYSTAFSQKSDSRGRVTVGVRFGRLAGPAGLIVTLPMRSIEDTIDFTVRPAALFGVGIVPTDTAVTLGENTRISIAVRDREGNARSEIPTIQSSAGIRVEPDGRVTGLSYGRSTIVAKFGTYADTASVTVVPPGRLAGVHGSSVFYTFAMNTDGSSTDWFVHQVGWPGGSVQWLTDAKRLLISDAPVWPGPYRIREITVSDRSERLVWSPPDGTNQTWADLSRNGEWIYFVHVIGNNYYATDGRGGIWRVRPDGSSPAEVVPPPPSGTGWFSPTTSSAGTLLAYVGGDGTVYVRTLSTGATVVIPGLQAESVQWAPNDDRLAVVGHAGGLYIVSADGTSRRRLRPGFAYGGYVAWSPDGKWVMWHSGLDLELVQLDPELVVALPFLRSGACCFAWTNRP